MNHDVEYYVGIIKKPYFWLEHLVEAGNPFSNYRVCE